MKEGWEYKKLPEISENLDYLRKPVTKKNRTAGIYPYYGASGIVDYVDDYLFDENLLCISEDGANLLMRTYPIAFSISGKVWVNNHAHVLRFKNLATQKYVEYFFAGLELDVYITGTAQPKLTQKALNNITINIPISLSEQQSVVDYLDAAFAKIDAMKANAEKALNEAKALFQASLKEMLEPKEGWEEKTIDDIVFFRNGIAHEKEIDKGGKYVVINSKFVSTNGRVRKYTNEQISPLYSNEIVMVMSDVPKGKTLAKCFIIECDNKYSLNQRICAFKSKGLDIKFLYYLLNRNPNLLKYDNGENQTNLRKKQILECPVSYPPQMNEQQFIVSTLDSLKSKVDQLQANFEKISQECDALKQAILRQVFE